MKLFKQPDKFCEYCSFTISLRAKYCENCGQKQKIPCDHTFFLIDDRKIKQKPEYTYYQPVDVTCGGNKYFYKHIPTKMKVDY